MNKKYHSGILGICAEMRLIPLKHKAIPSRNIQHHISNSSAPCGPHQQALSKSP
jgi:hypothetical protein